MVSYYLICIIKYVLLCMCKGYRNVDLVNVKGNDVVLNYGYDNLVQIIYSLVNCIFEEIENYGVSLGRFC